MARFSNTNQFVFSLKEDLLKQADALRDAGCDDPVFVYLYGLLLRSFGRCAESCDFYARASEQLESRNATPLMLSYIAMHQYWVSTERHLKIDSLLPRISGSQRSTPSHNAHYGAIRTLRPPALMQRFRRLPQS